MSDDRMVHIVDDEQAMRESLAYLLLDARYAVSRWKNGEEFLEGILPADQGCVLLDVQMPGMDGLTVQRIMAERGIAMPVIVLTANGDVATAVAAMKAGAIDFLEKPFRRAVLLAALDAAFDRRALRDDHLPTPDAMQRLATLTAREREILHGLAQGQSNKVIALALNISPRTVEVHRANLMAKLEVHNLSGALRLAFAAEMRTNHSGGPQPS